MGGEACAIPEEGYVAALNNTGFIRFYEFWMSASVGTPSQAATNIDQLANAVYEAQTLRIPLMMRAYAESVNGTADLRFKISAFLVAQAEYCYFGYSSGWYDSDWSWHQEYDRVYGKPLSGAVSLDRAKGQWRREFEHCEVWVDVTARVGEIRWRQ
eukprot:TRINITY_DN23314_c0_g1_i12.p2 TRINITY_DN23314_c0_g1~~TRINITY_DN23314_c0_g1_i12.p2  ORF type:complete len:156 (+),score=29.61 TRINITY_DN23314_c0_g1_i12:977-1444(+)